MGILFALLEGVHVQEIRERNASLECPTMVSANGAPAVMGIIEELDPKTCRLRSINAFADGDRVKFDFTLRGANKLELSGDVRTSTTDGTRRFYTIALDSIDPDAIVVALEAAQRFAASRPAHDPHTGNGLTRSSARIRIDAEVEYSIPGDMPRKARATNVSTGGILLNSSDEIAVGQSLELHFRLPGSHHDIAVNARVVAHQQESPNYNLAFFNVDPRVKEELAAFVAAHTSAG